MLSALPFAGMLSGRPFGNVVHIVAMEFIAWLAVWCVCKRPAWFHWLLLPAFIAVPVEVYLNIYYSQGISAHHLGILAETSPIEAREFLGNRVWWLGSSVAGGLIWWVVCLRLALKNRDLDWRDNSRWFVMSALGCAFLIWVYGERFGVDKSLPTTAMSANVPGRDTRAADRHTVPPSLPAWMRIPFEAEAFAQTWPFGLALKAHDFWKERQYLRMLADQSRAFRFGARYAAADESPQVIVMVIGESSRYDRWSLNGYARDTNPMLKLEPNLVSLSDVVTAVSATRLSVPVLVSRKPARQSLKAGFSERSFLSAFREAGYKTWWISNQMSFGKFDTPVSVFANEADVTQFLNLGGFSKGASYDEILLSPLKIALDDPADKKLIVLHTLGSHWNYSQRHPKKFDKWQPSLFDVADPAYTNIAVKEQLNNSYDNSILYTDWVLSKVIGELKSVPRRAAMMYVADHGQTLYDGSCKLAFHGHNTQFEFHIPALVWYSDAYRDSHPDKIRYLLRNKQARLATENIFHSLVDLADVRYESEQLQWSFLSPQFKRHKRYVDSYGWTDYDNSTFKGDCREVIDKGKPLAQER